MYLYQPSNRDRSSPWNFYFDPNEDKDDSPGIVTLSKGTLSGATPSGATPSRATPSRATPSGATPSGATPSGATPSGATPSGATPSGVTWNFYFDPNEDKDDSPGITTLDDKLDEIAKPKKKSSPKRTRSETTKTQIMNQNVEELSTGTIQTPPKRSQMKPNALPTEGKFFSLLDYMDENQGK
jgi:hypothetical protein